MHVEQGSSVYTDAYVSYNQLDEQYIHNVINHAVEYVRGNVHTNGIENFWVLLKRSIKGTYVSVEPFHLFRYLDEQSFGDYALDNTSLIGYIVAHESNTAKRINLNPNRQAVRNGRISAEILRESALAGRPVLPALRKWRF